MGTYNRSRVTLTQTDSPTLWVLEDSLTYCCDNGEVVRVSKGFLTDGYSKPMWSHPLVKGNFQDDVRPAIIHDYLCFTKRTSFKRTNDIFYEAMRAAGISKLKAALMRIAVEFNPDRW